MGCCIEILGWVSGQLASHIIVIAFLNMHVENLQSLELAIAGITAVIFIAAVA